MQLPCDPAIWFLGIHPRENKCPPKTCRQMFIVVLFLKPKNENNPNVHQLINGKTKYNGILIDHKIEWSTNTWYNLDKPWQHLFSEKTDSKGHILHDSIMWTGQNKQFHTDRTCVSGCQGRGCGGAGGECGLIVVGYSFPGVVDESALKLDWWWLCNFEYIKNWWMIHLKRVSFVVCGIM